jgi:hypothetical protein
MRSFLSSVGSLLPSLFCPLICVSLRPPSVLVTATYARPGNFLRGRATTLYNVVLFNYGQALLYRTLAQQHFPRTLSPHAFPARFPRTLSPYAFPAHFQPNDQLVPFWGRRRHPSFFSYLGERWHSSSPSFFSLLALYICAYVRLHACMMHMKMGARVCWRV